MSNEQMYQHLMDTMAMFMGIYFLVAMAMAIFMIVTLWNLFKKAGERGWAAIIPFYSNYVLAKIAWGNGWMFLLGFLPIGNIIYYVMTSLKIAKAFGKETVYGVGLIFLSIIFYPFLAFGKAEYIGTDDVWKKYTILASVGSCGVWLLLCIFL